MDYRSPNMTNQILLITTFPSTAAKETTLVVMTSRRATQIQRSEAITNCLWITTLTMQSCNNIVKARTYGSPISEISRLSTVTQSQFYQFIRQLH